MDETDGSPLPEESPTWLREAEKQGPLVRLIASMVQSPKEPPPPELVKEVTRDAQRRELARVIPPNTMGVHLVNLGELLLHQRRMEFQNALKSEDKEIDELHRRKLSINLRLALFADTLLDWLASLFAAIPGTLLFILKHAPIRNRSYRWFWMVVSLVVIGGVWFLCPWWIAAPFALLFSFLLFVLLLAGQFTGAEKFEHKLDEIMESLTKKQEALLQQRSTVSDAMQSFIDNPEEHLEDKVDQPLLEESTNKVDEDRLVLERARKRFGEDEVAIAYLDSISSITHSLAVKRAEARFACEREEIAIERRMAAKRWSSTVMAMSISKTTTLLRMFFLIFTLLLIPVVIAVTKGESGDGKPTTGENAKSGDTEKGDLSVIKDGVDDVNLKTIGRYGFMIVVGGIVSLLLAWTITFLLRIVPRHLQMMRAAKQAMIDGLINDWEWHKVQLRLFDNLLAGMAQAAKILGVELEANEYNMVNRDRLESERDMRTIGRRLERLTKKAWSGTAKGSKHKGGVMDSGAPEDLADASVADLLL